MGLVNFSAHKIYVRTEHRVNIRPKSKCFKKLFILNLTYVLFCKKGFNEFSNETLRFAFAIYQHNCYVFDAVASWRLFRKRFFFQASVVYTIFVWNSRVINVRWHDKHVQLTVWRVQVYETRHSVSDGTRKRKQRFRCFLVFYESKTLSSDRWTKYSITCWGRNKSGRLLGWKTPVDLRRFVHVRYG